MFLRYVPLNRFEVKQGLRYLDVLAYRHTGSDSQLEAVLFFRSTSDTPYPICVATRDTYSSLLLHLAFRIMNDTTFLPMREICLCEVRAASRSCFDSN